MAGDVATTASHRWVGRASQLAELADLVSQARTGHTRFAVVSGPAGIGKTSLLAAAVDVAQGATVLHATCREATADLGYDAVRQLLEPLGLTSREAAGSLLLRGTAQWALPALVPDLPSQELTAPKPATYAALHGLYWLLVEITAAGPLVLVIDDAQWCDESSLRWLEFLLRRADDLPLLVLLARRTEIQTPVTGLLDEIITARPCASIELKSLTEREVAEVVRSALAEEPATGFALSCAEVTGGNPLVLARLLDELRRRGLRPHDGNARQVEQVGRDVVTTLVLARLADQPSYVRQLATALSVLGRAEPELLGALCGISAGQVGEAVRTLRHGDILAAHELDFVHDVVRSAVLDGIPAEELRLLRVRAARLLSDVGRSAGEVASQLVHLDKLDEPWMLDVLRDAAAATEAQGATQSAMRLRRLVLDNTPAGAERVRSLVDLGRVLAAVDPFAAVPPLREALVLVTDPRERAPIAVQFAITAMSARSATEAVEVLGEVLDALPAGPGEDPADRELRTLVESSLLMVGAAMTSTIHIARARARTLPVPNGNTPAERRMLVARAGLAAIHCEPAHHAAELARRALAAGGGQGWDSNSPTLVLGLADDVDTALAMFERSLADSRARGDDWIHHITLVSRALVLHGVGDVTEAAADVQTAAEIAEQATRRWDRVMLLCVLATVLIEQGDIAGAEAALDRIDPAAVEEATWTWPVAFMNRARICQAQDDLPGALEFLLRCGHSLDDMGMVNPVLPPWRVEAAVVLAEMGRASEATDLVAEGTELARRWGTARARGMALVAEGVIADGSRSPDLLAEAVEVLAGSPARLEHGRAELHLGRALLRCGDVKGARTHVHRAFDLATRCGSVALGKQARRWLAAAGGRVRRVATSPVGLLTGSERRVAMMAAQGASNREIADALFVSLRTVESHLTGAYRKLGGVSRRDLSTMFRSAEIPQPRQPTGPDYCVGSRPAAEGRVGGGRTEDDIDDRR